MTAALWKCLPGCCAHVEQDMEKLDVQAVRALPFHTDLDDGCGAMMRCTAVGTALAHDAAVVVGGFSDGSLGAWIFRSNISRCVACAGGHLGEISCLALCREGWHEGELIFNAGHKDGVVVEWTFNDALDNLRPGRSWRGHNQAPIVSSPFSGVEAISKDGTSSATGGADGAVCLWSCPRQEDAAFQLRRIDGAHGGAVTGVAVQDITTGEPLAATVGEDGLLKLWTSSADHLLPHHDRDVERNGRKAVAGKSLSIDIPRRRLIFGAEDGVVRMWDVVARRAMRRFGYSPDVDPARPRRPGRRGVQVVALDFYESATRLASSCADGIVQLWDVRQCQATEAVQTPYQVVVSIALRGHSLLTASPDGSATLWDTRSSVSAVASTELALPDPMQASISRKRGKSFSINVEEETGEGSSLDEPVFDLGTFPPGIYKNSFAGGH